MPPTDYERIRNAIRYLEENFRRQPGLAEVARNAGLSEYHFHRMFSRWAGISPKRFLQMLTAEHARQRLRESRSVLDASLDAGLSGPGRLHDLIVNVYAVTPGELKEEGEGVEIRFGSHPTPFGDCLVAVTERGVCGLEFLSGNTFEESVRELGARWSGARLKEDRKTAASVAGRIFNPSLWKGGPPLSAVVRGTNFQVRVWEALVRIPPGFVRSYEDVAGSIGEPGSSRAVGAAAARNPVAFLIPCHRVMRGTGESGEYRWGATRKKAILAWEAARFRSPSGR